jgi:hypothetical protein
MLNRIILLLVSALLIAALAANVALATPPEDKGQPSAEEPKIPGSPDNPNGWGTVTSQRASTAHDIGEHASSFGEPRDGIGNVSRTDGGLAGRLGTTDTGDHPGDHSCIVDDISGTNCEGGPGLP